MKIPIFPLQLVIFPDSGYPLHIFEERYKKMVNKSIKENSPFGIISFIDNKISKVGTRVKVERITKRYSGGEFDIIIRGINRFIIDSYYQHEDEYLVADISSFEDTIIEAFDHQLADELVKRLKSINNKTGIELGNLYWDNYEKSTMKSYKLAEKCGLQLEQQQEFLEIRSELERFLYLNEHLKKVERIIEKNKQVKELIENDGYINY